VVGVVVVVVVGVVVVGVVVVVVDWVLRPSGSRLKWTAWLTIWVDAGHETKASTRQIVEWGVGGSCGEGDG
jgi:hypothetical protein